MSDFQKLNIYKRCEIYNENIAKYEDNVGLIIEPHPKSLLSFKQAIKYLCAKKIESEVALHCPAASTEPKNKAYSPKQRQSLELKLSHFSVL